MVFVLLKMNWLRAGCFFGTFPQNKTSPFSTAASRRRIYKLPSRATGKPELELCVIPEGFRKRASLICMSWSASSEEEWQVAYSVSAEQSGREPNIQ